jgi:MFS transporter, putative metabolite:H+ symporter
MPAARPSEPMSRLTMTLSPTDARLPEAGKSLTLSRGQLVGVLVCALGFTFDLSEISFGAALSGVFSAPPHAVPAIQLSWLLSSIYIGAILGPPFMGAFADRKGRRAALSVTLLFLAVTSGASALSPGIVVLTILRGLSGIALGAYPPLMITYLTDTLPPRVRGRWIMITVALAYLGPPATIFLMRWLTPLAPWGIEGWRWVIAIDAIGALISGVLFLRVPGSIAVRERSPRQSPQISRKAALVIAVSFMAPWATVTFPLLSAAFLVLKGFNLSDTLLYVGVATFGPFVASVAVAPFADRVRRRTSIVVCSMGMVIAAVGFYLSDTAFWLTLTSFAFNLFVSLYMPALNTYVAELFPGWLRGRATSWAWSANRVAAAAVPLSMLPWLHNHGESLVFAVIVGSLLMTILLVVCVRSQDA